MADMPEPPNMQPQGETPEQPVQPVQPIPPSQPQTPAGQAQAQVQSAAQNPHMAPQAPAMPSQSQPVYHQPQYQQAPNQPAPKKAPNTALVAILSGCGGCLLAFILMFGFVSCAGASLVGMLDSTTSSYDSYDY